MSRVGKCSLLLMGGFCVFGFAQDAAAAWPDAESAASQLSGATHNSYLTPGSRSSFDGSAKALPDFAEYYNLLLDRANFQKNPLYWNMPAAIELICRNSASVGYSEYLYCVDHMVNLVLESEEATSL